MGRDSSVGIATRYELDGPGIESRWGRDFQQPSRPALGPTQPPVQWVSGNSLGVKRPGRGVDHPPPSSAEVKERAELYLNSPSGPSWPVIGWPLPLPLREDVFLFMELQYASSSHLGVSFHHKILYNAVLSQPFVPCKLPQRYFYRQLAQITVWLHFCTEGSSCDWRLPSRS
jgi:hypothetical protein